MNGAVPATIALDLIKALRVNCEVMPELSRVLSDAAMITFLPKRRRNVFSVDGTIGKIGLRALASTD